MEIKLKEGRLSGIAERRVGWRILVRIYILWLVNMGKARMITVL